MYHITGCRLHHISIHALLAESDEQSSSYNAYLAEFLSTLSLRRATPGRVAVALHILNFYPRSPCGERPHRCTLGWFQCHFYPRSPCGERLVSSAGTTGKSNISIHALLAESDPKTSNHPHNTRKFLSTLSLRRATLGALWVLSTQIFLSTLSLRRATAGHTGQQPTIRISIHALLAESDPRS